MKFGTMKTLFAAALAAVSLAACDVSSTEVISRTYPPLTPLPAGLDTVTLSESGRAGSGAASAVGCSTTVGGSSWRA